MKKPAAKTLSLYQLMRKYQDKESVIQYLESIRWGKGEKYCTKCGKGDKVTASKTHPGRYWCGHCRGHFNAWTNTPMEYGKVELSKWIMAAYLLMTARKGIASLQLSKELDVTQTTAWYMLHRLRLACGDDLEALQGEIEMDTTYIGGKEMNKHEGEKRKAGRGTVGKQPILGMKERAGKVKAMMVEAESKLEVLQALGENVVDGSTIYSDEAKAYDGLEEFGYSQGRVNHSAREFVNEQASTNGLESVWAVLKRGYNGVYHNWSKKHCQKYVDEFSFRLNEGNCQRDTQDRLDDLFRNMVGKKITYDQLTA